MYAHVQHDMYITVTAQPLLAVRRIDTDQNVVLSAALQQAAVCQTKCHLRCLNIAQLSTSAMLVRNICVALFTLPLTLPLAMPVPRSGHYSRQRTLNNGRWEV